jgi:hypothetical protein
VGVYVAALPAGTKLIGGGYIGDTEKAAEGANRPGMGGRRRQPVEHTDD